MPSVEPLKQDQAAGLRNLGENKPIRVIAVTAGKGGVGKTNVSVNLGLALSQLKQRVMLLDADLGLANVDIMLGLHAKRNISHVLNGDCELQDIIVEGPAGIKIIPAASGVEQMVQLKSVEHAGFIQAFSQFASDMDVLIIDTAAGIANSVLDFTRAAQEVVVVVCDEPSSITDAYALIKVLSCKFNVKRFHVLANMIQSIQEGRELFGKLSRVTEQFLDVTLDYLGGIPYDDCLRKAVKHQKAVVAAYPSAKATRAFTKVAKNVCDWPINTDQAGHSSFFLEQLVQINQ